MNPNGVLRQPRGPPFDKEAEMNGRNSPTNWSGLRRRFSSEGGDFYREDGPDFSYSEYNDETNNNSKAGGTFVPQKESIYITHIESLTSFWAQSADAGTAEAIDMMSSDLQVYCQNKPVLQNPPFLKKIYGGIYNDDMQWYRCIVVEREQGEKVRVRFIDFGNTEVITKREMVCLSMSLINHKPYAQRYNLDGLHDSADCKSPSYLKGVALLNTLTSGKVLNATTKKHRTSMLEAVPVDLLDEESGTNINSELINKGYAMPSSVTGRISPSLPKEPISPLVRQMSSSPPITSTPKVVRPDPELQQLRETVKNQQNQINSQRHLNFQLKESHRMELAGLQKKVEEVEGKSKQEQEHVLMSKFKELMTRVNELRRIRHSAASGEESVAIFKAVELLKTINELAELNKVKSSEQNLEEKQNEIRNWNDKTTLPSLVDERNATRTELLGDIKQFCDHMSDIKLDEWRTDLEVSQKALKGCTDSVSCSIPNVVDGVSYMDIISEYEEWVEISKLDQKEVRIRCDQQLKKFKRVFNSLLESIEFEDAEDKELTEDLDVALHDFETVLQEEITISKRTDEDESKKLSGKVLAILLREVNKEIEADQLRYYLNHFKALKAHFEESIVSKPNLDQVIATRKTIRSLKSKIGHKLIDKDDMKEREDADEEEIKECEEELSKAYSELHAAFCEDQKLVRHLAVLSCVHFPELPLQHPELAIKEWLATNGLVISGRSLDHYPHDSKAVQVQAACHIIDTKFAGKKCLVKEYILRDAASRDMFQTEAVNFHNVPSARLIPLQALFYDKKSISPYLQVPSYVTVAVWLTSTPSLKEIGVVMKGALEGLKSLHEAGLVHGGLVQDAVLVDMADETSGVLDHYDFSQTVPQRVSITAAQLGLDPSTCHPTPAFDMLCYGTVFAKTLFPELTSIDDFSLHTEDKDLIGLVEGLTASDNNSRLTAQQALEMPYFRVEEQLD